MSTIKTMGEKMFNSAATASTAASSDTPAFTTASITRRFPSGALTATTGASRRSSFLRFTRHNSDALKLTETLCTKDEKVLVNTPRIRLFCPRRRVRRCRYSDLSHAQKGSRYYSEVQSLGHVRRDTLRPYPLRPSTYPDGKGHDRCH